MVSRTSLYMSPSGARGHTRPWWLSKWQSPGDGLLKQLVLVPISTGLTAFLSPPASLVGCLPGLPMWGWEMTFCQFLKAPSASHRGCLDDPPSVTKSLSHHQWGRMSGQPPNTPDTGESVRWGVASKQFQTSEPLRACIGVSF